MKTLTLAALSVLIVAGSFPAIAADTTPQQQANVPPADDSFAARRETYLRQAQDQMDDWRHRVEDWTRRVANSQTAEKTKDALRDAWVKTEVASRRLAVATEKGWDDAKASFEDATQKLKDEWKRDTR